MTLKECFETFKVQEDWENVNRYIENCVDQYPIVSKAEKFFKDLFEVFPLLSLLSPKALEILIQYLDYVDYKNNPPSMLEIMTEMLQKSAHQADIRPGGKCEMECGPEERAFCPIYQQAIISKKPETVH